MSPAFAEASVSALGYDLTSQRGMQVSARQGALKQRTPPLGITALHDCDLWGQRLWEMRSNYGKEKCMKILTMTGIIALALPVMAIGQTTEEPQQSPAQTKETQTTAPAKGKKTTKQATDT